MMPLWVAIAIGAASVFAARDEGYFRLAVVLCLAHIAWAVARSF